MEEGIDELAHISLADLANIPLPSSDSEDDTNRSEISADYLQDSAAFIELDLEFSSLCSYDAATTQSVESMPFIDDEDGSFDDNFSLTSSRIDCHAYSLCSLLTVYSTPTGSLESLVSQKMPNESLTDQLSHAVASMDNVLRNSEEREGNEVVEIHNSDLSMDPEPLNKSMVTLTDQLVHMVDSMDCALKDLKERIEIEEAQVVEAEDNLIEQFQNFTTLVANREYSSSKVSSETVKVSVHMVDSMDCALKVLKERVEMEQAQVGEAENNLMKQFKNLTTSDANRVSSEKVKVSVHMVDSMDCALKILKERVEMEEAQVGEAEDNLMKQFKNLTTLDANREYSSSKLSSGIVKVSVRQPLLPPRPLKITEKARPVLAAPRPLKATTPSKWSDQKRYTLSQMKNWRATVDPQVFPSLNCPFRDRFGQRPSFMRTLKYSKKDLVAQRSSPLATRSPCDVSSESAFQKLLSFTNSSNVMPQLLVSTTAKDLSESKAPKVELVPQRKLLTRQFGQINTIIARKNCENGSIRRINSVNSVSSLLSSNSVSTISIGDPELGSQMAKSTPQSTFVENNDIEGPTNRSNSVNSLTNLLSTPSLSTISVAHSDEDVTSDGLTRSSQMKRIDLYDLKIVYRLTYEEMLNRRRVDTNSGSRSFCYVCHIEFEIKVLLYHHCERQHGEQFRIPFAVVGYMRLQHFELLFADNDVGVSNKSADIQMFVKNCQETPVLIERMFLIHANKYKRIDISYKARKLYKGHAYQFVISRGNLATDSTLQPILVFFTVNGVKCVELQYIQITRDNTAYWKRRLPQRQLVIDPIRPGKLSEYRPSPEIIKIFNCRFETDSVCFSDHEKRICDRIIAFANADPVTRLNPDNYVEMLTYCIEIADCSQERGMMSYDQVVKRNTFQKIAEHQYAIQIDENTELPPDLAEYDFVTFLSRSEAGLQTRAEKIVAQVVKIESDSIIVRVQEENEKQIGFETNFRMRFKSNRVPNKMERQALSIVEQEQLVPFLFPTVVLDTDFKLENLEWFDPRIGQNPEQAQAVQHIVAGTSQPSPYIIFGPPGTGKTSTVVESICQLWKTSTKAKILVTAQSNAACNELLQRLLAVIPSAHLYRMFAPSMENKFDTIDDALLAVSNLKYGYHEWTSWKEFYTYRIVVCTLITAGRLVQANIDRNHFTHVFIDECGSASEPSALIPLAGVLTTYKKMSGNVILAGDIKQLGPIVKSRTAESLGYAIPLMERLMQLPIYQKDPKTGAYNPLLITKLVRSFRSHSKIIEFANNKFYDGDLQASGPPATINCALNWNKLPNPSVPVIFVPCYGESGKDEGSFSLYNMREIEYIVEYVMAILLNGINGREIRQQDVGVISPYKRQVQKIRSELEKLEKDGIEVGTVENFQGREKLVIIISTVRSRTPTVGFLDNPKRLNVTITRAQALQIIIGNPATLKTDPYWCDLLDWCAKNRCCTRQIQLGQGRRLQQYKNWLDNGAAEEGQLWDELDGEKIMVDDFF